MLEQMTDAELDAAIADAASRFTAATLEKQRRGASAPVPTNIAERVFRAQPHLFALLAALAALVIGSQILRLFK